jgi:hypothetical protein
MAGARFIRRLLDRNTRSVCSGEIYTREPRDFSTALRYGRNDGRRRSKWRGLGSYAVFSTGTREACVAERSILASPEISPLRFATVEMTEGGGRND